MLSLQMAELLVQRLASCTDYNINVMNEKGVIIASSDPERVGQFHEAAFKIVSGPDELIEVEGENTFLGTRAGINMAIKENGKKIGVIGITGETEKVRPIALVLKLAVETLIEGEEEKAKNLRHNNQKQYFFNCLTHDNADPQELVVYARKLNYPLDRPRIPILIVPTEKKESAKLLERVKKGTLHSYADISSVIWNDSVLVYKCLSAKGIQDYRGEVLAYLEEWNRLTEQPLTFFVGTIQDEIKNYPAAYRHCMWLMRNIKTGVGGQTVFFYDYVTEYLQSRTPLTEQQQIFGAFSSRMPLAFTQEYLVLLRQLIRSNFNLVEASRNLYIHKNTLTNKLNRIRQELNLNPYGSAGDRSFMTALYGFLAQKNKDFSKN